MYSIFKELLQKSDSSGSRSTILKPLTWFITVLLIGITTLVKFDGPKWLIIILTVFISLTIGIFLFAYIYCLFTDKDAIRSESYSIRKLQIEKGLFGDNLSGIINDKQYVNDNTHILTNNIEDKNI